MTNKVEKAKEILISLIRNYLVQISVAVQKTNINENTLSKDVREEYISRLNNIWSCILPRQVGKYNDKLYRQICNDLRTQFTKAKVWVVKEGDLLSQLNVIILDDEKAKGVTPSDGDLIIFAKALEFLSTGLYCNKPLMIEVANIISVNDIADETKKSINESIIKALADLRSTFEKQRKPTTPSVREEIKREYREFYTNLFTEKFEAYNKKVKETLQSLKQHNMALEDELRECYEKNNALQALTEELRSSIEELRKSGPCEEDKSAFNNAIDKLLDNDEEKDDEKDDESVEDFAFGDESALLDLGIEPDIDVDVDVDVDDSEKNLLEEEEKALEQEPDEEPEEEDEEVVVKKQSFSRRRPYGRR